MNRINLNRSHHRNFLPAAGRQGFTLVEVLITIAIMAVLAGLVFGLVGSVREKNAITTTEILLARINSGLEKYKDDNGDYPYCGIPEVDHSGPNPPEPGWRFREEAESGEVIDSTPIPNRYTYQQSSFVIWKALSYDQKQKGEEPYLEYPSNNIDPITRKDDPPGTTPSITWDKDYYFGFLDYFGEPIVYLYWQDNNRPAGAPKAVPGFESSYELWSAGPDKLFGDFFAENEADRDADNVPGVRLPMVKNKIDRYEP